jgi:UDP-N-acetyl-D-mannosaminuronic acid dehydrogenase
MTEYPSIHTFQHAIETKATKLAVIGLGYVGLPVAAMFARVGFEVVGVDLNAARVGLINKGENPIQGIEPGLDELIAEVKGKLRCTTDYAALGSADVIIISVQTPVEDDNHLPRYDHLRAALKSLGAVLKPGALVIIESTLAPGTMQRVVIPTLTETAGETPFYVGHCPERVMPGKLLYNITHLDRAVGGQTPDVAGAIVALYRHIVQGALDPTDMLTAELVKTTENAYRDVQIAFANEVARICAVLGGDVWKVRELVNKSPGRNMLYPGAGVGGHCIPKDSWLLMANIDDAFSPALLPAARAANRAMPGYVLELTRDALAACGKSLDGAVIAVLGYAYRENSDDTRDTPTQYYIAVTEAEGAMVRVHDPFVEPYKGNLDEVLRGADAAVILVAHDDYKSYNWGAALELLRTPAIIDARCVLPGGFVENIKSAQVRILGQGAKSK